MATQPFLKIAFLLSIAGLILTPGAADDGRQPPPLSAVLSPIREAYGIPALGACVLKGGRVVAAEVVGIRKAGSSVSATNDDSFHLGSCTKAFTAVLIARLVEEGKLDWNLTLPELFPTLRTVMHPAYRRVTLTDLLTHRAGLPEQSWPADMSLADLHALSGTLPEQRLFFTRKMLAQKPAREPGSGYLYSNAGYVIAGAAAERVTGRPWERLMSAYVFTPLGMTSAGFGAMGTPGTIDQPWQHEPGPHGLIPIAPGPHADNPPVLGPAGTIHCSLADWASFVSVFLDGPARGLPLLSPSTIERLLTPPAGQEYAMGWIRVEREWGGGFVYTHAGSNTRNWAVVWMAPEKNFALMVTANRGGDDVYPALDQAAGEIIRLWLQ